MTKSEQLGMYRRLSYLRRQHELGIRRMSKSDFDRNLRDLERLKKSLQIELDDEESANIQEQIGKMSSWWRSGN